MCEAMSWQIHLVHRLLPLEDRSLRDRHDVDPTLKKNFGASSVTSSRTFVMNIRGDQVKADTPAFKTVDTHGAPGSAKDTAFKARLAALFSGICSLF